MRTVSSEVPLLNRRPVVFDLVIQVPEPSLASQAEVFGVGQRQPLAARPLSLDCVSLLGTHYPTAKCQL